MLWSLLALGTGFAVASLDAAGQCFTVPCIKGKMSAMYSVNGGESFQMVVTSFLFLAQPILGLWFLVRMALVS